eukprot:6736270-Pyramimonas_sp.AAC.2
MLETGLTFQRLPDEPEADNCNVPRILLCCGRAVQTVGRYLQQSVVTLRGRVLTLAQVFLKHYRARATLHDEK